MSVSEAARAGAAGLITDLIDEVRHTHPDALIDDEPEQDEPVAEEAAVAEPELPEEIQALLAEEDPEEEPTYEPAAEAEPEWEQAYDDSDQLRQQLHQTQKQLEHAKKESLRVQRKEWEAEVAQHFPLLPDDRVQEISGAAESRRGVLKAAKQEHDLLKLGADRVMGQVERLVAERLEEERAKLHAQWGTPVTGPGPAPVEGAERADVWKEINAAPSLHEKIRLKIKHRLL